MNPYTFVPLAGLPVRERPAGHDRFSGNSGELRCLLSVRTPLFLYDPHLARPAEPPAGPGHEVVSFPTDQQGRPVVWGTALRGALRAVVEAASRSCLALFDGHYERWTVDYRSRLPAAYRRCEPGDPLCPACRLFGTVGGALSGFAGAVAVGDALAETSNVVLGEYITVSAIQSPKPHHQAFYLAPDGEIAGRKFYYHHPNGPTATIERSRFTRTVQPLAPGSTLAFSLTYRNVSDADLALLLSCLLLEPGLGHKLGMGKPIGMGSVTVEVLSARNSTARDMALGTAAATLTGAQFQEWSQALIAPTRATDAPADAALRAVLMLDPGRPIAYPTADWFRSHPEAPLSDVPDVQPAPPAPRRVLERPEAAGAPGRVARPSSRPGPLPERRGPAPARPGGRRQADSESGSVSRPLRGRGASGRDVSEESWRERPDQAAVEQPASAAVEEPVAESRPATLEDLVRRFSRPTERPEAPEPTQTKESARAREEQRRIMERLRRRER